MVVTDLAQSPDLEVLSTDRLYQILSALKHQNDAVISFDTVQELARRAGVKHVLVGNYVKSGDAIRINITLQEAESGRIVTADRIDAADESSLFPTVDDLTRRVKAKFSLTDRVARSGPPRLEPAGAPAGPSSTAGYFRELSEVTTSSLDAYRSYVQGIDLHQRGQERDAEPLLKKAIEIDPKFALAMTKLAVIENNLGHGLEREEYGRRAVELVDRLSPRERYYIEGYYYSLRTETMAKAIESYQRARRALLGPRVGQAQLGGAVRQSRTLRRGDSALRGIAAPRGGLRVHLHEPDARLHDDGAVRPERVR